MQPVYSEATLARILSQLREFTHPKASLDQYATPSHLAARLIMHILYTLPHPCEANDLAAGTGILGIGLALQGLPVRLYELDPAACQTCNENIQWLTKENLLTGSAACIQQDILRDPPAPTWISILNPPYGMHGGPRDTQFLIQAFRTTTQAIGAILPPPFQHHARLAKEYGFTARLISEEAFPLKAIHMRHKKPRAWTRVLLILFSRDTSQRGE